MQAQYPYKILWGAIPLVLLSLLFIQGGSFDLQLHDTYIVFSPGSLVMFVTIFFGMLGGIYWILRNYSLNGILSIIHTIVSILTILALVFVMYHKESARNVDLELFRQWNGYAINLILILLGIQILFLINIIIGVIRGKKKQSN